MKKYIPNVKYGVLSYKCDTPDEAERKATLQQVWNNSITGACKVFGYFGQGCELFETRVAEFEEREYTEQEFEDMDKAYKEAKEKLEQEIHELEVKRLQKYWDYFTGYFNMKVPYNLNDYLRVKIQTAKGGTRYIEGRVCDVYRLNRKKEIRPHLANGNEMRKRRALDDENILNIEIIGHEALFPNQHCKHCERFNNEIQQCALFNLETKTFTKGHSIWRD